MPTHPQKVLDGGCQASNCKHLDVESAPAVDAEVAARVTAEFERYLEMKKAFRKMTGRRRWALLSGSTS